MIGKIQRVKLKEIWKHEAHDFTKWLQDNIDILNDVINLSLSNPEREKHAGSFLVDLVAEDADGNPVIIENQLEKSDHEHLGKLLTYLVAIDAKTAVWIVSDPRPEHVAAISWLNESSSANFYLIKLEGIRIGNSDPAPLLTLIVGPSEESRIAGEKKKEMAERHRLRFEFWKGLLERAKEKAGLHESVSPQTSGWIGTGAGKSGLSYNYVITQNDARVELYIDRGKDSEQENKTIFDQLHSHRKEIEEAFGDALEWERLDTKRASRISKKIEVGGYKSDKEKWPQIQDAMIDAMMKLENSIRPFINKLKI